MKFKMTRFRGWFSPLKNQFIPLLHFTPPLIPFGSLGYNFFKSCLTHFFPFSYSHNSFDSVIAYNEFLGPILFEKKKLIFKDQYIKN